MSNTNSSIESGLERVSGRIGYIHYHARSKYSEAGNKFLVADLLNDDATDVIKIKGEMNSPVYGWKYEFWGHWDEDAYSDGRIFKFNTFSPFISTGHSGIEDYLSRHVPELGPVRSKALVAAFGDQTLAVLRDEPARVLEVEGIGEATAKKVIEFFASSDAVRADPSTYARLYDLLSPIKPPRRIIDQLLKYYGSNSYQLIRNHPYKLLDFAGMGWKRVDTFAIDVLHYDPKGLDRQKAAVIEAVKQLEEQGHTKVDIPSIKELVSRFASLCLDRDIVSVLCDDAVLVDLEDGYVSFINTYWHEKSIAAELTRIFKKAQPYSFAVLVTGLEEEQIIATTKIEQNPVAILSGCPGSGKSYSVARLIQNIHLNEPHSGILVIAPTGKAAKRNSELLAASLPGVHIDCSTIHRALGAVPSDRSDIGVPEEAAKKGRERKRFGFTHTRKNPLQYDYIFVDEASMCDASLAASFLEAVPDGARLVWVGDHFQLPSVGPGAVLRDMIIGGIPTAILHQPRRNSGLIAQSCYDIKEGRRPRPASKWDLPNGQNWMHIEESDEEAILEIIKNVHEQYMDKYGAYKTKTELQVISPEKKGIVGCHNLNTVLSRVVNSAAWQANQVSSREFVPGDKVIRKKNKDEVALLNPNITDAELTEIYGRESFELMMLSGWRDKVKYITINETQYLQDRCYLVNGDMGEVIDYAVYLGKEQVITKFTNPNRLAMLPVQDSRTILAYAITVHSAQGSGFDTVVMPLIDYYWNDRSRSGLWCRETAYTGFSRAINRLITVGKMESLQRAISRRTIGFRQTRLRDMLLGDSGK
jgi:exodeoxyribonuclease V alpha subunit